MSLVQIIGVLVLYVLGIAASATWAISLGENALIGFILWTSFFAFSNAMGWVLWWSREHWLP